MIEHIVLLKFREDVVESAKQEVIQLLRGLKAEIPGIVELRCGRNFSTRSQGYDVGLIVRFTDQVAADAYQPHPAHQAAIRRMEELGVIDKIVVDFEVEG
jgi:heme-degrading monooxygenase HmoA